jgi:hypothetical protein
MTWQLIGNRRVAKAPCPGRRDDRTAVNMAERERERRARLAERLRRQKTISKTTS